MGEEQEKSRVSSPGVSRKGTLEGKWEGLAEGDGCLSFNKGQMEQEKVRLFRTGPRKMWWKEPQSAGQLEKSFSFRGRTAAPRASPGPKQPGFRPSHCLSHQQEAAWKSIVWGKMPYQLLPWSSSKCTLGHTHPGLANVNGGAQAKLLGGESERLFFDSCSSNPTNCAGFVFPADNSLK